MKQEKKTGKEEKSGKSDICSVIHCHNPGVSDGYCETHLERLDLIKESYEQIKQMQIRAREDTKGSALEREDQQAAPAFGQTEEYIE